MVFLAIIVEREGSGLDHDLRRKAFTVSWLTFIRFTIPLLLMSRGKYHCALTGTGRTERWAHYCGWAMIILPTIADREETPVLTMIIRRKAFTVLGLMFMQFAMALLVRPCNRYSNASRSRCVRLNCRETCDNATNPEGPRSSRTAMLGCEGCLAHEFTKNARQE